MIIGMQGSRNFDDYNIFRRAMGTALYSLGEDKEITERSMKARGLKMKIVKMPPEAIKERLLDLDYFIYFGQPKEPVSDLVEKAEAKDVEVVIYRY